MSENLQYPIGKFVYQGIIPETERNRLVEELQSAPSAYRALILGWPEERLDRPYRPGGWTARQLLHHVADSHLNGYIRTRLALTEERPTIRPYDQDAWANLGDIMLTPVGVSLQLLELLHQRWADLWRSLRETDFARTYYHPGQQATVTLDEQLAHYHWHSYHHLAHLQGLAERENWL